MQNVKPAAAHHFKHLLLTAIQHLQQLHQLLNEEHELLASHQAQAERLESLAGDKTRLLEQIEADIRERIDFLVAQDKSGDQEGLEAFLQEQPDSIRQALGKGWQQLVDLMEKVQQQNLVNGRLVNRALQHCDMLLDTLQQIPGQKVRVYNPSGGAGDLNLPRNLGKA